MKEVFAEACRLDAAARDAFLADACGADGALRQEVDSLLDYDRTAESALDRPPLVDTLGAHLSGLYEQRTWLASAADGRAPERIGPYRIIREIGHGGMGIVYEAEQENPRRTVALKVIGVGLVSSALLRRFEVEAHVLGLLQHPGIAQIYEAGTARVETDAGQAVERPFFAMEYVRGEPLSKHARQHALGIDARLRLLANIGDAVHHAHQKGVIHRDLKPGNILVDVDGQPKVLDFGVARVTAADVQITTAHTDVGQLVGTLPYMSPEQVSGGSADIDVRSDVYALGVIGFELLTGHLPYDLAGLSLPEAARVVTEVEAPALGTQVRDLRGDVSTIIAKTLEKDRERRYASAAELAADIRRYLSHEPVSARPATTFYQLRKFTRRHGALVAGVAATFVALAAGVVVSTTLAIRATRAERLAADRLVRVQAEADKFRAINEFFNGMLVMASPTHRGAEVRVVDILDEAAERIDAELADQPQIVASLEHTLGQTYFGLGVYERAGAHLSEAVRVREELLGPEHDDTLRAKLSLAQVLAAQGEVAGAEALARAALGSWRERYGADHALTLQALNALAAIRQARGDVAEAETLWRETLAGYRRLADGDPLALAGTLNNLGQLLKKRRQPDEAAALLREALELQRTHAGPTHPDTLATMGNLGLTLKTLGALDEAESLLRQLVEARRETLGHHPDLYLAMNNLARLLTDSDRLAEAEPWAREAVAGYVDLLGTRDQTTWIALNNLASLHVRLGRPEQAEEEYRDLLSSADAVLPEQHWLLRVFERNYGECLTALGRFDEAERLLLGSFAALRESHGLEHEYTHKARLALVALYEAWERPEEAQRYRTPDEQP